MAWERVAVGFVAGAVIWLLVPTLSVWRYFLLGMVVVLYAAILMTLREREIRIEERERAAQIVKSVARDFGIK